MGVAHATSLNGVSAPSLYVSAMPVEIELDTTPPTITASPAPAPNAAGWNNTAVTVSFVCTDAESGVASCEDPITVTGEGSGLVVTGDAADIAGNTASTSVSLDIDLTGPAVDIVGVSAGDYLLALPTVTCSASDALSGVNGSCSVNVTALAHGLHEVEASASDLAGNDTVVTETFWVLQICGTVPPNVPCVVPTGYTYVGDLDHNAYVLVLGEITGKLEVLDGSIMIGSTGARTSNRPASAASRR